MTTLEQTIEAARDASSRAWEMAIETTVGDDERCDLLTAQWTECDALYALASAIVGESMIQALGYLESAAQIERDGGDDQHARRAIGAVLDAQAAQVAS